MELPHFEHLEARVRRQFVDIDTDTEQLKTVSEGVLLAYNVVKQLQTKPQAESYTLIRCALTDNPDPQMVKGFVSAMEELKCLHYWKAYTKEQRRRMGYDK